MSKDLTTKTLFSQQNIKAKFEEMMGKKAQGFITSVLQIVASNDALSKADPMSIYNAAAMAATLDLPLNNNLGFAYIIPFNQKQSDRSYKSVAQFQIGYKGFIQLAQRSGQFKTISAAPIFEGQIIEENPLTGFVFDFTKKKSDLIVGYAAFFSLINGFEKTLYMNMEQIKAHGRKYSKTFTKTYGLWNTDFEAMAIKTVTKLLLAKYGPLSIEMQKAIISDQGLINNAETEDISYIDNESIEINKEHERIVFMIEDATTIDHLDKIGGQINLTPEQIEIFNTKKEELKNGKR